MKIQLGPEKGKLDDQEFDIVNDVIGAVSKYQTAESALQKQMEVAIKDIKSKYETKLVNLKLDLFKTIKGN